tara:strand:- start:690 stop:908 length:219 start_codon:yes stop_codon:yes gene_type:complete
MAINFPSNPVDEATFVANGVTYNYVAAKTRWQSTLGVEADGGGAEMTATLQTVYDAGSASASHISTLEGGTS